MGKETTFAADILDVDILLVHFKALAEQVFTSLDKHKLEGKRLTIKVKYKDFTQVTRSKTMPTPIGQAQALVLAAELLNHTQAGKRPVRLVGLTISSFEQEKQQDNDLQLRLGIQ